jgi:hypothetical protein
MKNKIYTALEFLWYSTFIHTLILVLVHLTGGIKNISILLFSIPFLAINFYFVHFYFSKALKEFRKALNLI